LGAKLKFFFVGFCLIAGAAYAMPSGAQNADSSSVEVRLLSAEEINAIVADPDYLYDRIPPTEGPWEWFKRKFSNFIERLFNNDGEFDVYDVIQFAFLAAIVALFVIGISRSRGTGLFLGKRSVAMGEFTSAEEDIHEIDYDSLITAAVESGDYRVAVRLQFLRLLKRLTDADKIDWEANKTNREYYAQMQGSPLQRGFRLVYTSFEYVWYGEFPLDKSKYEQTTAEIEAFSNRIAS
jgi:hypothetical protein